MQPSAASAPTATPRDAAARFRVAPWAFVLGLSALHAAFWLWAQHREQWWAQAPVTDQSSDLTTAVVLKRALLEGGPAEFARAWVFQSRVHAPLVPAASALLMAVFGESRPVAECVLPLSTLLFVLAMFRAVERLYGRATAYAATALASTFPVYLIFGRTYLLDYPLTAMLAASCWTMLRTDGFARLRPTLLFGVVAGLTSLTRGGAPALLVGPTLLAAADAVRRGDARRRMARLALATLVAIAIAATWYGPNLLELYRYVHRATYGEDAALRTGGGGALSLDNVLYCVQWNVAQGPGLPMALIALVAAAVGARARRGEPHRISPTTLAVLAAYAIDFFLMLLATQRHTARFFQPLMPFAAILICRAVRALPSARARLLAGAAVAGLAAHHVVALTFAYSVPLRPREGLAAFGDLVLWSHRPYFLDLAEGEGVPDRLADFRIPEIVDRLAALELPADAPICAPSVPHPFFQQNGLVYEATLRRRPWTKIWTPALPTDGDLAAVARVDRELGVAEAVLLRTGDPRGPADAAIRSGLPSLFDPRASRFEPAGDAIAEWQKANRRAKEGGPVPVAVIVKRSSSEGRIAFPKA